MNNKKTGPLIVAFFVAPAIGIIIGSLTSKYYVTLFENVNASVNPMGWLDFIFFVFAYPMGLFAMLIIGLPLHKTLESIPRTDNIFAYGIVGLVAGWGFAFVFLSILGENLSILNQSFLIGAFPGMFTAAIGRLIVGPYANQKSN